MPPSDAGVYLYLSDGVTGTGLWGRRKNLGIERQMWALSSHQEVEEGFSGVKLQLLWG